VALLKKSAQQMVRRGSPVRVRKRAQGKPGNCGFFGWPRLAQPEKV
jgi:hypothetical protein